MRISGWETRGKRLLKKELCADPGRRRAELRLIRGGQCGFLMPRQGEKERRRFEKKKRRFQQKEKREKTDYSDEYAKRCIN